MRATVAWALCAMLCLGLGATANAYQIVFTIDAGAGKHGDDAGTYDFDFSGGGSSDVSPGRTGLANLGLNQALRAGRANANARGNGNSFASQPIVALAGVPVGNGKNRGRVAPRAGAHCYTRNVDGSITMCAPAFSAATPGDPSGIMSAEPRLTLANGDAFMDREVGEPGTTAANNQPKLMIGDASLSSLKDVKLSEPGTLGLVLLMLLGLFGIHRFVSRDKRSISTCASV